MAENMRERFCEVLTAEAWRDRWVERVTKGTRADFLKSFDDVADNLKSGLERLLADLRDGKVRHNIQVMDTAPLFFQFAFPVSMSRDDIRHFEDNPADIKGLRRIHEVCADPSVDMNIAMQRETAVFEDKNGERVMCHMICLRIQPQQRYRAQEDLLPRSELEARRQRRQG